MELEFDKEIDALLRKARGNSPAAAGAPAVGSHMDADELAAFAENALPERSRQMYVAHLADCDECRKTLSGFIATTPEKAAAAAAFASAPAPATRIPWYRRLFAGPNLAYTMGALVVVFAGLIGVLVLQNQQGRSSSIVSQVANKEPAAEAPHSEERTEEFSNSSMANSEANTTSSSPVQDVTRSGVAVGSANPLSEQDDQRINTNSEVARTEPAAKGAGIASVPTKEEPAAPPVAAAKDEKPVLEDRDIKTADATSTLAKSKADSSAPRDDEAKKLAEQRTLRELAPSPKTGPSRAAGPKQQQANVQNSVNERQLNNLPVNGRDSDGLSAGAGTEKNTNARRSVAGKTFEMRNGVWYDSAYHGGGTKDVKRGTEKFLRLDEGLRNIANGLGGTVVVIWDGKTYKIK